MKKVLSVIMVIAMIFSLAACGNDADPKTGDQSKGRVFTQGFDLDYPPYSFLNDDGSVGGFDVELAQAVCEYLGWEYKALPFNWDAKDAELNSGSCDCIWSGLTVQGREDDYLWSVEYSDNTQMVMVPENSGIKTAADLAGKVVGVQTATSAYALLTDEENAELYNSFEKLNIYETYTIAFSDLKAGAIDAIAIDATTGSFLMNNASGFRFIDEVLGKETYAIGFRKDDEATRDAVNGALKALAENGKFDEIGKKYPDIYDYLCLGK